jgi:putative Holliday junction resolvase
MKVLGIDYGRARLGLALSDEGGVLASPLPPLERTRSTDADVRKLARLAVEQRVGRIVIGLPLHMNGSEGEMAEEVHLFAELVKRGTGLPIGLIDERLTSAEAERVLVEGNVSRRKRKGLRDSLAAVLILQADLDRMRTAIDPMSSED